MYRAMVVTTFCMTLIAHPPGSEGVGSHYENVRGSGLPESSRTIQSEQLAKHADDRSSRQFDLEVVVGKRACAGELGVDGKSQLLQGRGRLPQMAFRFEGAPRLVSDATEGEAHILDASILRRHCGRDAHKRERVARTVPHLPVA